MHGNANTHEVDFVAGAPGLMQQCVDENNSIEVCTCCSRLCSRSSITVLGLHEVPHLELLLRDLPPTAECTRHGLTTHDSGLLSSASCPSPLAHCPSPVSHPSSHAPPPTLPAPRPSHLALRP
jgi:hypothetical protein